MAPKNAGSTGHKVANATAKRLMAGDKKVKIHHDDDDEDELPPPPKPKKGKGKGKNKKKSSTSAMSMDGGDADGGENWEEEAEEGAAAPAGPGIGEILQHLVNVPAYAKALPQVAQRISRRAGRAAHGKALSCLNALKPNDSEDDDDGDNEAKPIFDLRILETAISRSHAGASDEDMDELLADAEVLQLKEKWKEMGYLPIHEAASRGKMGQVTAELNKGISINEPTPTFALTPLMVAAQDGQGAIIEKLIKKDADVQVTSTEGWTAILLAVKANKSLDAVTALLAAQANLGSETPDGLSVLNLAAQAGNPDVVQSLLEAKASPAPVQESKMSALHLCVKGGAASEERANTAEVLLRANGNPNGADGKGRPPLAYCVDAENIGVAKALLNAKADPLFSLPPAPGIPVFLLAVSKGKPDMVNLMLECKAPPMTPGPQGRSPLHLASLNEAFEVCDALLAAGAMMGAKDSGGYTPLLLLVKENKPRAIQYLIKKKASLQEQGPDGVSALHLAVAQNNPPAAEGIIKMGCPINMTRADGFTALLMAVESGNAPMVGMLLKMKADPKVKAKGKGDAKAIAKAGKKDQITAMLKAVK